MLYFIGKMIQEEPIRNFSIGGRVRGYRISIRQAQYRGGYLSCIDNLEVTVDGERVPEENITFCVNNKRFAISQLPDMYMEYWYVLDKALIEVTQPEGLAIGKHTVEITMYIRSASSGYFNEMQDVVCPTTEKKTLSVEA